MNTLGASALRRVLVVDPDADARSLYRQILEHARCDVVEASDGRDALTKALVQVPSLVITEFRLPFVDGFALCEILRRDRLTVNVPILIVTADTRPSEVSRARTIADAVLTKPTMPDAVANEVQRLLLPMKTARDSSACVAAAGAADKSTTLSVLSPHRRSVLVKTHSRFSTTTPSVAPPRLKCPSCDVPLKYDLSYVGGVSDRHPEQWDYFSCSTCGTFQYRQRTHRVRRIVSPS
jgi:CheY-like chemotaxis protein